MQKRKKRLIGKALGLPPGCITTPQAARIAGLPSTMLRRWVRRGALHPTNPYPGGSGHGALWSWDLRAVVQAKAIAELYRAGIGTRRIAKAVAAIRASGEDLAAVKLVAVGRDVFHVIAPEDMVSLVECPGQRPIDLRVFALDRWAIEVKRDAGRLGLPLALQRASG